MLSRIHGPRVVGVSVWLALASGCAQGEQFILDYWIEGSNVSVTAQAAGGGLPADLWLNLIADGALVYEPGLAVYEGKLLETGEVDNGVGISSDENFRSIAGIGCPEELEVEIYASTEAIPDDPAGSPLWDGSSPRRLLPLGEGEFRCFGRSSGEASPTLLLF